MTYSNKHLSNFEVSPERQRSARGCCLSVFVTLLAAGAFVAVSAVGWLPAW